MDETKETKSEPKKEKTNNKKSNKFNVQALAIIAGILLILLICDTAFGNGAFSWLNKKPLPPEEPAPVGYNGLLVGSLTGSAVEELSNYEVMYDEEGQMIYELINNGKNINAGEGYTVARDVRSNARTIVVSLSKNNVQQKYLICGCVGLNCLSSAKDPCKITGEENLTCEGTYTVGNTEGACKFVPRLGL